MAKVSGLITPPTSSSELSSKGYTDSVSTVNPVTLGMILLYAGTSVPSGFLVCDGAAVSRAVYTALHTLLQAAGYPYGSGDGVNTFNLPNMKHRFPVGKGGPNTGTLGPGSGSFDHTHTQGDHYHGLNAHTHSMAHEHTFTGHTHNMSHTHGMQAHTHRYDHSHTAYSHYHGHSLSTSSDNPNHSHNIATRDDSTNGSGYMRGSDDTGTRYNNTISVDLTDHTHGLTVNYIGNSSNANYDSNIGTNSTNRTDASYIPSYCFLSFAGTTSDTGSITGPGLNDTYPNHTFNLGAPNTSFPNQNTANMNSTPAMGTSNPPFVSMYYVIKT